MKKLILILGAIVILIACKDDPVLRTMIFQPGPDEGIDTYFASSSRYMDLNFGDREYLRISAWTDNLYNSPNDDARVLINFKPLEELSSSKIVSVLLTLYGADNFKWDNGGQFGDNASVIYIVTESWDENSVTWNNQPAYSAIDSVIISQNNDYDSIIVDITDLTINMLQYKNGFLIKQLDEDPYSSMVFSSSDSPTKEKRPKLTVKYWD